jgi:hypothetical protein
VDGSVPGSGERELLAVLALNAGRVVAVPASTRTVTEQAVFEDAPTRKRQARRGTVTAYR